VTNLVDEMVRGLLLSYPLSHKTRWSALRSIFLLNGNGLEWHNGILVGHREYQTEMQYCDIDEREQKRSQESYRDLEVLQNLYAAQDLDDRKERRDRAFIAENIDIYASRDVGEVYATYEELRNFDFYWSTFRDAPYETMHPDFRAAMLEVVEKISYFFNRVYSMHGGSQMWDRMPDQWKRLHNAMVYVRQLLEPDRDARIAKQIAFTKGLLAEILAEEKADAK
jgi:hypothetical protein